MYLQTGVYTTENGETYKLYFHDISLAEMMLTDLFFFGEFTEYRDLILNINSERSKGISNYEKKKKMTEAEQAKVDAFLYFRLFAKEGKESDDFKYKNYFENAPNKVDGKYDWEEILY